VASLSLAQQKTIEKEFSKSSFQTKYKQQLETDTLFARNLENLQGDECDVLIIGIGYGPNADGKMTQNFGVLNKNGGHNRLNVLITRARENVVLFSSIQPESIKLTDNEGVNYLKDYMQFLINPKINTKNKVTDFESIPLKEDQELEFENGLYLISKKERQERETALILNPFADENIDIEQLLSRISILKKIGFKTKVVDYKSHYYKEG